MVRVDGALVLSKTVEGGGRAPCDAGCESGQQPIPDADSVRFREGVAARCANEPGAVFGLYNEPYI